MNEHDIFFDLRLFPNVCTAIVKSRLKPNLNAANIASPSPARNLRNTTWTVSHRTTNVPTTDDNVTYFHSGRIEYTTLSSMVLLNWDASNAMLKALLRFLHMCERPTCPSHLGTDLQECHKFSRIAMVKYSSDYTHSNENYHEVFAMWWHICAVNGVFAQTAAPIEIGGFTTTVVKTGKDECRSKASDPIHPQLMVMA